jgi:SAM-dependent methyltransferase
MSGFSTEWLALREPFDMRARDRAVLDAVTSAFRNRQALSIVDLGSGTGSTVRALSARLPKPQSWKLVDNDPVLLAEAFAMPRPADVTIETQQFDLSGDLGPLFDGADLVTASALIDLVSEPWLANLAAATAARSLPVYIALTYDGRASFSIPDPADERIISAVNAHQRRNKGFGPALGPRAAASATRIFQSLGYAIVQRKSDWVTASADGKFQIALLAGWVQAAGEMGDLSVDMLQGWFERRREAIESGKLTLSVGHVDLLAEPRRR